MTGHGHGKPEDGHSNATILEEEENNILMQETGGAGSSSAGGSHHQRSGSTHARQRQGSKASMLNNRMNSINKAINHYSSRIESRAGKTARARANYWNNWGKVIFPIVLSVFTVLYFVLSLI